MVRPIFALYFVNRIDDGVVIQWAKKTGDYSVLSHADLCVLALTYGLDVREKEATKDESSTAKVGRFLIFI